MDPSPRVGECSLAVESTASLEGLTRLFVEPLLRAMMEIRAHPISLADRPVTAIVTRRQSLPRKKPRLPTLSVKRSGEASPIFA